MKRFARTFLIAFVLVMCTCIYTEVLPARDMDLIAAAPAFTRASYVSTDFKTKKGDTSYRVEFRYAVEDKQYKLTTDWMDEEEATRLRSEAVDIAYVPHSPDTAVFREDLEHRLPHDGLGAAISVSIATSLTMALMAALVNVWARRRKP